jgi:hypothetical protein
MRSPTGLLSHRQEQLLSHPQQRPCPVTSELIFFFEKSLKFIGVPHHADGQDSLTQIKYCKSRIANQEFIN